MESAATTTTTIGGTTNSSSSSSDKNSSIGSRAVTAGENIDSKLRNTNSIIIRDERNEASNSGDGGSAPVPNFRVEGSSAGDSSITVAVAVGSLSTSLTSSLVKSDNECASLVDSSLGTETETEEPGVTTASTNGDLLSSLQSSEPDEMPLSLVSWYSEPGDCVSTCSNSACCGGLSLETNGDLSSSSKCDAIVKSDHSQATPTAPNANVDFVSEEKENKTPASSIAASTATSSTSTTTSHIPCRATKKKEQQSSSATSSKKPHRQKSVSSATSTLTNSSSTAVAEAESSQSTRRRRVDKMHVQVFEQKSETTNISITSVPGQSLVEQQHLSKEGGGGRHRERERERVECPRCSRRSKSGSTPAPGPANAKSASRRQHHNHSSSSSAQQMPNGTHVHSASNFTTTNPDKHPASRQVKKPIKSILKSESRSGGSGGSGSGSEKLSSMDSLGSNSGSGGGGGSGIVMTRSDVGPKTKFYINNANDSNSLYPEDRMVAKLKRIEKYATLRLKKGKGSRLQTSSDEVSNSSERGEGATGRQRMNSELGGDGAAADLIPDLMTKSMSFLEKSSVPFTQSHQSRGVIPNSSSGPSSLKRQGSLKLRKPSPGWEPCATRTSALRLLKMQESKGKTGSFSGGIGSGQVIMAGPTGSAHSGSGESIQNHGTPPTSRHHPHHHHLHASRSATIGAASGQASYTTPPTGKERGNSQSAKVFTKLSSVFGQTASSSMKRLKQEKSVQTDSVTVVDSITSPVPYANVSAASKASSTSNSPEPLIYNFDPTSAASAASASASAAAAAAAAVAATANTLEQQTEQIKQLESLVKRYKTSALRFQKEFERTDKKNIELKKQLQENQMESNEMLEFLQAEKSTLAESLVEVETECKKLTRELESVVKESQSRCSSLVRLSEQHKQEALKAQTLLNRLEVHTNTKIAQQMTQLTEGREAIRGIKTQIMSLIDTLMRTYKVSQDRLTMDGFAESTTGPSKDETELRCTLLLPLIRSLSRAFDSFKVQLRNNEIQIQPSATTVTSNGSVISTGAQSLPTQTPSTFSSVTASGSECGTGTTDPNTSLQKLNQAIIEREKAETVGLDSITMCSKGTTTTSLTTTTTTCMDHIDLSLHDELDQLQVALRKLCTVIRIIVIHCDQKVSNVASDILQVLKSETDKLELHANSNGNGSGLCNGSKLATTT